MSSAATSLKVVVNTFPEARQARSHGRPTVGVVSSRRRITRAVGLLAMLACSCQVSGSADAAFPGRNGLIAFTSGRGSGGVFRVTATGGGLKNVAPGLRRARWSPKGKRLVADGIIPDGPDEEIFAISADGRSRTRITRNTVPDYEASWSPDGRWILYVSGARTETDPDLYKIRPNGSARTRIAATTFCERRPTWAPDGTRIAFLDACAYEGYQWPLYVMKPDGTEVRRLPIAGRGAPAWSPDGRQIALGTVNGIVVLNSDGSDIHTLTSGFDPAWSPDGRKIAFAHSVAARCIPGGTMTRIFVIRTDGTGKRRLTPRASRACKDIVSDDDDFDTDWQPLPH